MTPRKAVKQECKHCKNGLQFVCYSDTCQLNNHELTHLKRIKAHCITCVPEQNIQSVRKCTGKVLNPEPHDCPLHPYRLGHNPKSKGKGNPGNLILCKKSVETGQFLKPEALETQNRINTSSASFPSEIEWQK